MLAALVAGLARPKMTFRQRNLYCQFSFGTLPTDELQKLEAKAARLGDYILAGRLQQKINSVWAE
ncbi:hypothetical protein E7Z57_20605 (plasmid) [Ralstonia pseudosolanacearum]|uniref:Uncharacterized protein n=1 Tax=Ralstonia solanacearum TaxID=305 RepID=A0AA92EHK4_RALSL|nr:hypothetical protein E7Z57_20605 [Ralstonia pseudosolanacearum]